MAASNRTQKRRRQLIVILTLFIGLVGAGIYMITSTDTPEKKVSERQRRAGEIAMPVLRRNLGIGSAIKPTDMTIVYTTPDRVPDDAIIRMDLFTDRWVTRNLKRGDYIKEEYLAESAAPKGYSGLIDPGQRVIVLPVEGIEGTTGYLRVGDRLDVAVGNNTRPRGGFAQGTGSQPGRPGAVPPPRPSEGGSLDLVAEAALVLEVPSPGPFRRGQPERDNVVLAMNVDEAYHVQLAHMSGRTLRFLFRPFNEEEPSAPPVTADPANSPVVMVKGNNKSKVTTRNKQYIHFRGDDEFNDFGDSELTIPSID